MGGERQDACAAGRGSGPRASDPGAYRTPTCSLARAGAPGAKPGPPGEAPALAHPRPDGPAAPPSPSRASYPRHSTTGSRGYFGNAGSVAARRQREKREPRVLRTTFRWRQLSQRPAGGALTPASVRAPHNGKGPGRSFRNDDRGPAATRVGGLMPCLVHLMNKISEYRGSGHRSSATIFSSWSPYVRTFSIAASWWSRA